MSSRPFVYICHAGPDKPRLVPFVDCLAEALPNRVQIWLDRPRDVSPTYDTGATARFNAISLGESWRGEIEAALDQAGVVLAFWTETFRRRFRDDAEVLHRELEVGKAAQKLLIVRLDPYSIIHEPYGRYQFGDVSDLSSPKNCAVFFDVMNRLASLIGEKLNTTSPPTPRVNTTTIVAGFSSGRDTQLRDRSPLTIPQWHKVLLPNRIATPRSVAAAESLLSSLINDNLPLFSPSNTSPLTTQSMQSGPGQLLSTTEVCFSALRPLTNDLVRSHVKYKFLALVLFYCMGLIGTNRRLRAAEHYLNWIARQAREFPELLAQTFNMLSVVYGKTERDELLERATEKCIELCRAANLAWLQAVVEYRICHKFDWSNSEKGKTLETGYFLDTLHAIMPARRLLTHSESWHLMVLENSMASLHYRWLPDNFNQMQQHLTAAMAALEIAPDRSERTRIEVERAMIEQRGHRRGERALDLLKSAISNRASSGEYARLRYDLTWLAELYLELDASNHAATCAHASIALHSRLYGRESIDRSFLDDANRVWQLSAGSGAVPSPGEPVPIRPLEVATGLPSLLLMDALGPERLSYGTNGKG